MFWSLEGALRACGITLVAALLGCVRKPSRIESPPQPAYRGLYFLNEGQWTLNNSSLDVLSADSTYYEEAYRSVNGQPLGDVANAWWRKGDTLWIVLNSSRLVRCLSLPSLRELYTVAFPPSASPREFLPLSPEKAYVNSLLDGTVYRLNPHTGQLLPPHIPIENYAESMVWLAGQVWVSCGNYAYPHRNNKLAYLDPARDSVLGYLTLPEENPGPLLPLPDGELLVGCRGNYADRPGMLVHVDPIRRTITRTVPLQGSVYRLALYRDQVYFLSDSGVSRYDWRTGQIDYRFLTRSHLGLPDYHLLYGFFYDSLSGAWIVLNARAGGVRGEAIFVGPEGVRRRLPVGVFPSKILRYP